MTEARELFFINDFVDIYTGMKCWKQNWECLSSAFSKLVVRFKEDLCVDWGGKM
jgi:hypothetical protein